MSKVKLTLSVDRDLLKEARLAAVREGRTLSELVEEYLEYLAADAWLERLAGELGLGPLEPTSEGEVPASRPRGLNAAEVVRELRGGRASEGAT